MPLRASGKEAVAAPGCAQGTVGRGQAAAGNREADKEATRAGAQWRCRTLFVGVERATATGRHGCGCQCPNWETPGSAFIFECIQASRRCPWRR